MLHLFNMWQKLNYKRAIYDNSNNMPSG